MKAFLCKIVGHRRSRSHARRVAGVWRSHCRLCGEHMVRSHRGRWLTTRDQHSGTSCTDEARTNLDA